MIYQTGKAQAQLIHGDTLEVLPTLEGGYSMVIADPPYASGGGGIREKQRPTSQKYGIESPCFQDFEGDARDLSVDGAIIAVFTDWRQLPSVTDALQWAGWLWRGIVVWDKVNPRPQLGRYKQQCDFVVWGSKGPIPTDRGIGVLPGLYSHSMPSAIKRLHQTEKPVQLLTDLMQICPAGGKVLVPFMGSGSDIEAALLTGHDATGIEITAHYYGVSTERTRRLAGMEA